jgi:uncharacterized protein (DUF849 family)
MEKLIITAAVVGALTTRDQSPNLPYSPQEIAKAAIESWKAGAAEVHLHTRDPLTGNSVQDVKMFKEIIWIIRNESDVIVNITTGGGPGMTLDERITVIPELSVDPRLKPDMASLNCGSLNFGILSRKRRKFVLNVYDNHSVCGTWEKLADAVYQGGASALLAKGWQAIGTEKSRWADEISPYMVVENNQSPSFQYFQRKLRELAGIN